MDRLRSLPTNRVSVPLGQSGAEGIIGAYGLMVLMVYGLIVGRRPRNGIGQTLAGTEPGHRRVGDMNPEFGGGTGSCLRCSPLCPT